MNHSILVIVNSEERLQQVKAVADPSPHTIDVVVGVENAIAQLYQFPYEGILYEDFTDSVEERKLLKIISLEQTPPSWLKKEPAMTWEECLEQLLRNMAPSIRILDGAFENDIYNICLN